MKWLYAAVVSVFFAFIPTVHAAPVDLNNADAKALDKTLVGVGAKTAQAIVDYRAKHGPFKTVDDLAKVKGISKATVEKNRANLTVGQGAAK